MRDPIRNKDVKALPEEMLRQQLLHELIHELGYPASLILCEKSLKQLPHLALISEPLPQRRIDILCCTKAGHPLLMIECKAVKLSEHTIRQVLGYNYYVQAPFVSIANAEERKTFWKGSSEDKYDCVEYIPRYEDLIQSIS